MKLSTNSSKGSVGLKNSKGFMELENSVKNRGSLGSKESYNRKLTGPLSTDRIKKQNLFKNFSPKVKDIFSKKFIPSPKIKNIELKSSTIHKKANSNNYLEDVLKNTTVQNYFSSFPKNITIDTKVPTTYITNYKIFINSQNTTNKTIPKLSLNSSKSFVINPDKIMNQNQSFSQIMGKKITKNSKPQQLFKPYMSARKAEISQKLIKNHSNEIHLKSQSEINLSPYNQIKSKKPIHQKNYSFQKLIPSECISLATKAYNDIFNKSAKIDLSSIIKSKKNYILGSTKNYESTKSKEESDKRNKESFNLNLLNDQELNPIIQYRLTENLTQKRIELIKYIKEYYIKYHSIPKTTTNFYRIGKVLGKGAFGKVCLAVHILTGKYVAIKCISNEILNDKTNKDKVKKEVAILQTLNHQSVIKLFETFESKKYYLLVFELCVGGDLLTYVRKRRKLKEPNSKVIFKQIIEGINHCHSKQVLHRDIKLDNILLNSEGKIKVY